MVNKLISYILILIMSCQCLVNMGIITYYQLNKEYIADVLCINRDKPELQCQGKCFLTDQLKKDNQSDKKGVPATQQQKIDFPSFLICVYQFKFHLPEIQEGMDILMESSFFSPLRSSGIFHPPRG